MRNIDIAEARKQLKVLRDSVCLDIEDKDTGILVCGNISDEDMKHIYEILDKRIETEAGDEKN